MRNSKGEIAMKVGYIGLGKMGFNMAELLLEKGHQIIAYDRSNAPVQKISKNGRKEETQ